VRGGASGTGSTVGLFDRAMAPVLLGTAVAPVAAPALAADAAPIESPALASAILFEGATPITAGPYAELVSSLAHPDLAATKAALAEGRLRLSTDAPRADGSRRLVLERVDGATRTSTAVELGADGALIGVSESAPLLVWAYESDPTGPGALQPVAPSHFGPGGDTLHGPRIRIAMPKLVATEIDDFTFEPSTEVASGFPAEVKAVDGHFEFDAKSPLTGATTAFYATAKVIEGADRWAGHEVSWGEDGKLTVEPYRFASGTFNAYFDRREDKIVFGAIGRFVEGLGELTGFSGTPTGWDKEVEGLILDAAKSRDVVAHEAGHAALDALKPGLKHGMGTAIHEGYADVVAFLTALDDPDVVARVLAATEGDMTADHEASVIGEAYGLARHGEGAMRVVGADTKLDDLGLERDDIDVPGLGFTPSRDPHKIGEVLSRASRDFFVTVFDAAKSQGRSSEEAIAIARETTGTVLTRAMRYIGEPQASLREVAIGMIRVDRELYDGANKEALEAALADRGLIDEGEDVYALIDARRAMFPEFTVSPSITEPAAVLAKLAEYEAKAVEAAADLTPDERVALLWHNRHVVHHELVKKDELRVDSDVTAEDGVRVIRLAYDREETDAYHSHDTKKTVTYYISIVFDAEGQVADVHNERPVQGWM